MITARLRQTKLSFKVRHEMTRQDTLYILSDKLIKIFLSDRFWHLELRVILRVLGDKVIECALFAHPSTVKFFIRAK